MTAAQPKHIAVFDVGKTNAKLAIVDTVTMSECAVRKTANTVLRDGPYPHFDVERFWSFFLASLKDLNQKYPVDAISITTHGASGALVKEDGTLALPSLDYEHPGPNKLRSAYDAIRPPFIETFSPRLPGGLNLGAQLYWQQKQFPEAFSQARHILTLPQYWAFRMTGVAASEATSLGCHTDLWDPATATYSSLVDRMDWRDLFPPIRSAFDALGPLHADICARTGVRPGTRVHCGIHDSNASFLPHLLSRKPPFSVVSTGTWVIVLSSGGDLKHLDPARDTLANTDAFGHPVASARFMGGREYEELTAVNAAGAPSALDEVLKHPYLLLPSVELASGPFPGRTAQWLPEKPPQHLIPATASLYLAMMTATSLELTGAKGDVIVEGPFAKNQIYLDMLSVSTGRQVVTTGSSSTGTSIGAALLALGPQYGFALQSSNVPPPESAHATRLGTWREQWLHALNQKF
jgi:sugar (pentulose or hexulose) kinase